MNEATQADHCLPKFLEQQMNMTRLLCVNFGGIGDEILFLPLLQSIRGHFPDRHITLLLEPRSQSVVQVTNLIDATISFDIKKRPLMVSDLMSLVGAMRDGGFDLVISSGSSPLVSLLLFLSGIGKRVGYDTSVAAGLLLTDAVKLNRNQYAAYMYHDLAAGLGIATASQPPEIVVSPESSSRMAELIAQSSCYQSPSGPKVLLHPGTSKLAIQKGIIKTWSAANWARLIEKLTESGDLQVFLAGGPDDDEIVEQILQAGSKDLNKGNFSCLYGKTRSLSDLAALINLTSLLVCVDSAPMHLAVGLRKRLVALFGPTRAELLLPKDERFTAIEASANSSLQKPSTTIPGDGGVPILPDVVYQKVWDQLQAASAPESSLEFRH